MHTYTSSRLDSRRSSTITCPNGLQHKLFPSKHTHSFSPSLSLTLYLTISLSPPSFSLSIYLSLTLSPLSLSLSLSHSLSLSLSQLCYKVRTTYTNILLVLNILTDIPPVDLVCFPSEISRSRSLYSLSLARMSSSRSLTYIIIMYNVIGRFIHVLRPCRDKSI